MTQNFYIRYELRGLYELKIYLRFIRSLFINCLSNVFDDKFAPQIFKMFNCIRKQYNIICF